MQTPTKTTIAHSEPCSCGEIKNHIIGRRQTADGKHIYLWSTGELTWVMGFLVRGSARPKSEAQRREALCAGWLVLGDVCLYDQSEIKVLVRAARWAAKRDGMPGTMRARILANKAPRTVANWTVLQTDRDGRPTLRAWIVRIGVAVWHERGKYAIMYE